MILLRSLSVKEATFEGNVAFARESRAGTECSRYYPMMQTQYQYDAGQIGGKFEVAELNYLSLASQHMLNIASPAWIVHST